MAATATALSTGPRYAPEDPSLPKPWKGLVDGKTGYLYFWNPETNVTQYERPVASSNVSSTPQKSFIMPISSSVQIQQSSQGQQHGNSFNDDDDKYSRGSNIPSKFASGGKSHQSARGGSDHSHNVINGAIGAAYGGSSARAYGSSNVESGSSAESYRRRHEITITGDSVPPPFTSFEASGFPSEILREVRYLLQRGAKCRTLCCPLLGACIYLERPYAVDQFLGRAFRITHVRGWDCRW